MLAKLVETMVVKDGGHEWAVRVTINAPSLEGLDVQDLAQKARRSPMKKIVGGSVVEKVEAFGQ